MNKGALVDQIIMKCLAKTCTLQFTPGILQPRVGQCAYSSEHVYALPTSGALQQLSDITSMFMTLRVVLRCGELSPILRLGTCGGGQCGNVWICRCTGQSLECEYPQCPLKGTWTMHVKQFPW
ncbi:hypothetical protein BT96DRAFT_1010612 [Gymnopus androsaceus JB14]|uniref:Uncharacterized protein n=1 Tax=Gymnopus androsaceus JB14 TaxID=1447944 RepID=A0A6A4GAE8_9AGAR|nr:hypothetical protein BT96DRAFT_1010612 [Gymnopus androsaceus JB14]